MKPKDTTIINISGVRCSRNKKNQPVHIVGAVQLHKHKQVSYFYISWMHCHEW